MRKREKERKKCFYYSLYIFISSLQLHSFAFHPPLSLSLSLCLSLSLSLSLSLASHQLIFITKNNSILFSTNSHFSPLLEFFPTFTFFPPFSQEIKKRGRETRERGMERYPLEVAKGRERLITAQPSPLLLEPSTRLSSLVFFWRHPPRLENSGWKVSKQAQNFPRVFISTF